jgi:hypothetical protein
MLLSVQYPEGVRVLDFLRAIRAILNGLFLRPGST